MAFGAFVSDGPLVNAALSVQYVEGGMKLNEIITEAIRYWEQKRIIYNVGLFIITAISFATALPESLDNIRIMLVFQIFILAVLANVAYSAAYIVDVFVLHSDFASIWRKYRWILFAIGFAFAAINTWFISVGIFTNIT